VESQATDLKLVPDPGDYRWSNYNAHLTGKDNKLVKVRPLLQIVHSWKELLRYLLRKLRQRVSEGMNAPADLLAMIFLLIASNWKSGNH